MPGLDARQVFEGPETVIDVAEVGRFCSVVRNEGEVFKTARNGKVQAPLDFVIVAGWQRSSSILLMAISSNLFTSRTSSRFHAPFTNKPYSKISRDFNPIQVNPYFSDFLNLTATITRGMWSSAATRKFVETVAAKGHPERILNYNVNFVGMVIPGDELSVDIKHIGMRNGAMVLKVTTSNQ
ncbi:3-oxoacyl-[acyl-carrier-protein] synthase [Serendipita sp. 401]|nr:3-oxoacyl-[acyl-carrier-protein] synthase [Serendipita sp. 401]KAG9051952.1 3-oxoacyl-[acyl-carrier-protein] synthase [Serendipita sp. 407]